MALQASNPRAQSAHNVNRRQKQMTHVVKALVLVLVAALAVAIMTWGLITNGADPNGLTAAVLGLLAYLATWAVGLFAVGR